MLEDGDWFVYYATECMYIGKVLFRPHWRNGPFVAFYRNDQIADTLDSLGTAVDIIDRYRNSAVVGSTS